jgi:hypothetical protein
LTLPGFCIIFYAKGFFMKGVSLVILGILAAFLTVGCSQPIDSFQGMAANTGSYAGLDEPFTVSFTIGADGTARSVAGSPDAWIKGSDGPRNFVQVFVLDEEAETIVGFAEDRKLSVDQDGFTLEIENLLQGRAYSFLLLMGNLECSLTGTSGLAGNYTFSESNHTPTLLAAGLTTGQTLTSGSDTITISMHPIVVDTEFSNSDGRNIEPRIINGNPRPAYLFPGEWTVNWSIWRSKTGKNGFEKALIPAQQLITFQAEETELLVPSRTYYRYYGPADVNQDGSSSHLFTYPVGPSNLYNGDSGWVSFNLQYAPFNLTGSGNWAAYQFTQGGGYPMWIIRNGLNDEEQTEETLFAGIYPDEESNDANWNGAIRFIVGQLDPDMPDPDKPSNPNNPVHPSAATLLIGASFVGNPMRSNPLITYTTSGGYGGGAEVWYAVVGAGGTPVAENYHFVAEGVTEGDTPSFSASISNYSSYSATGYDLYLRLTKNGVMGPSLMIPARPPMSPVSDTLNLLNRAILKPQDYVLVEPNQTFSPSDYYVEFINTSENGYYIRDVYNLITISLQARPGYTFAQAVQSDFESRVGSINDFEIDLDMETATITYEIPAGSFLDDWDEE